MAEHRKLLQEVQAYVTDMFRKQINDKYAFHNLAHTEAVVNASMEIATSSGLDDEDKLALALASWFHDTGFSAPSPDNHERTSINIATQFLGKHGLAPELLEKVAACIEATRIPQEPKSLIGEIICDADLYHLGTEQFGAKTKLLRKELNEACGKEIGKKEWRVTNIRFLEQHKYFTRYCREKLEPVKQENLKKLRQKEATSQTTEAPGQPVDSPRDAGRNPEESHPETQAPTKKKPASERTERGISTMFRIMSSNHNDLSGMADSKANIMISVNSIIISILVSVLLGRLSYYTNLIIPTIMLIASSLGAIIFAILATRPKISPGKFTKEDVRDKKINLLFFGSFYNMKLEEYGWAMNEMMNDRTYLYDSMVKDIYYLGIVLARKYRYLRISYNIFMFGLIVSMVAFAIAMFFPSQVSSIP